MMSSRPTLVVALLLAARIVTAQPATPRHVQVANPGGVEFEVDAALLAESTTLWHVELLRAADAPATAQPVKAWDSRATRVDTGLRVEFGDKLIGVPDGEYIATIRAAGPGGPVGVAGPFVIYGHAASGATNASDDQRRSDRYWTKVAIAIGAAIVVIPFLVR